MQRKRMEAPILDWTKISKSLTNLLKLKYYPVAVKLFKNTGEIPKEARKPRVKITVCQFVSLAKTYGRILYGTAEDIACAYGISNLGFKELPEDIRSGERSVYIYAENREATKTIIEKIPRIEAGKFKAFVVAPLQETPVDPDIVLVSGNPAQITRLILGITWKEKFNGRLFFSSSAHSGICGDSIAATYNLNSPHLGIPCYGARSFALFQDDELVMGIPAKDLEDVVDGLTKTHEAYLGYPITPANLESPPPPLWIFTIRPEKPPENWKEKLLKAPRKIL